ncbi:MAG: 30S ribosome-binding factor RbfA [Rhodospirillales bacterium]|nr:30S ribosome-binding factor RbfA [Rhodospirillales bacterium]
MSKDNIPAGQRQLRVGEELRHALAWVFERGEIRDPAFAGVSITVTEVRISPDLRRATVFILPLGGVNADEIATALTRARGFLRRRIGQSMRLRYVPDLAFRVDRTFDEADRIGRALRSPDVAADLAPDDDLSESNEER